MAYAGATWTTGLSCKQGTSGTIKLLSLLITKFMQVPQGVISERENRVRTYSTETVARAVEVNKRYDRCESPNVKKAKLLEADLSDIKEQVKGLVAEKENLKHSIIDTSIQAPEKPELSTLSHPGPSPLDSYLKLPERTEASPYKKVPDVSFSQFNAPVLPGFKDAWSILQKVQKSRGILETNMEAVLQAQQSAEVYTMLEALYNESSNPEGAKIQKLVDKHIKKLRREVEREVTDDLVLREIGKVKATGVPGAVKVPAPAPAKPTGRYGTRSRLHEPKEEPKKPAPVRKPAPKPAPVSRPAPKRTKSMFEDESKLTQVYGKAAYQKGRTTVKDPYLHYQNTAKHKAPRPAGVMEVQGKEKMSSKTQTTEGGVRQFYFNPNTGTYIPIASASSAATPVSGQLVPMAVPLGGPRMDPGMSFTSGPTEPVTFRQPQPSQVTAASNVAMVTVGGEDQPKPVHELGKQVLPTVDIDTDVSEMSEVMEEARQEVKVKRPEVKPKKQVQIISPRATPNKTGKKSPVKAHYEMVYHDDHEEVTTPEERDETSVTPSTPSLTLAEPNPETNHTSDHEEVATLEEREETSVIPSTPSLTLAEPNPETNNNSDDTLVEEDDVETAPGLEFPGYQPVESPDVPYNGPAFPPQLPATDRQLSSDLIAADIRRRDLLQNKANEWMEQELMARIISEVYPLQEEDRLTDLSHVVSEGSEDSMAEEKEKSMFVMDSIGHRGLQLFVDMGQPVDSSLVNNLIQEVLSEKIRTMLGERPYQDGQPQAEVGDPTEPRWEEPVQEELEEPPVHEAVVRTPEPTPKASPISSPHRPGSPAYTPIPSPPLERQREEPDEIATPRLYEAPLPVVMPPSQPIVEPESEPESSSSYDIKEELRRLADQLRPGTEVGASVQSHHDIATPPASPKLEPPPPQEDMYRPLTPPQLSPRVVQEPAIVDMRSMQAGKSRSPDRTPHVSKSDSPKSPKSQPLDEQDIAEQLEDQPAPVVFTVAETQTDVAERPRSHTSTPTKDKSHTPSESSYTESSSVSESFNECVSEGQWLVNKSDGEVADFPIDDVAVRERMLRMAHKKVDVSSASTWKDIDDMDDIEDLAKSEGEFVYKAEFPPEKDPVLDLLARLQTAGPQYGLYNMNQRQVTDVLNSTGKSEGEVIRVAPRAPAAPQWEEPPVRQAKPNRRSNSQDRRSPSPQPKSPSPRRSKSPQFSQSPHKRAPSPLYRTQSPTRVSFEDEQIDQRSVSPTRGILKQPRQYGESQGRPRREEDYDLPVRDSGRGQAGRLSAGGRQPMPRGMIGAGGRTSPGKPSMRRPPQVIKSSTMPEASSSGPRVVKVRTSSEDFRDSNDVNDGYYSSLRGTRSMTPDQMNTDALIQSGYLSQSFSQSETNGRHTGHSSLKSSGDLGMSRTSASGRSLGYSYGTESSLTESELRRLATGGTGRLQMSLTIPGTDMEGSDLSEIDITDGGNTK